MAEVHPFRGVQYNQGLIANLADVICPPYDIINSSLQRELYRRSEYNFVRLEFQHEFPQDTGEDNKYTRAAAVLCDWLDKGVLLLDKSPAIYLHDHHFMHQGRKYRRRGMTVLVRLEEWSKMVVRPHEGTLNRPKSDRLNLLWALKANTSPILALFTDEEKRIASVLDRRSKEEPIIRVTDFNDEEHILWPIVDGKSVSQICEVLAGQPLYIADGHHRYESALTYMHERIACAEKVTGDEPFHYVMMTIVDFDDPGLVILPAHRLVGGLSHAVLGRVLDRLETFFDIEEVPLISSDIAGQVEDMLSDGEGEVRLLMYGLDRKSLYLLRLKDTEGVAKMMPHFHSEHYRKLNVSVLDHVVLEKILGVGVEEDNVMVHYLSDAVEAVQKVQAAEYQLVFMLNPVRSRVIKDIADAGDRMPRKSTYFYPKLPSGLVFYRQV
ncbi:DUF1015 domain-containing protein [Chloroflexota bacterium]